MSDYKLDDILLEDLPEGKLVLPEPYFAEEEYDIATMVADMRASGNWGRDLPRPLRAVTCLPVAA